MNYLTPNHLPHYTYEDYARWEGLWELIDGVPFACLASARKAHQRKSFTIMQLFEKALQRSNCSHCELYPPIDWKIKEDTVICPDFMIVCDEPEEGQLLETIPILVGEILSPSSFQRDKEIKYKIYEEMKVKYYLIVDVDVKTIYAYQLIHEKYELMKEYQNEILTVELPECSISVDCSLLWK